MKAQNMEGETSISENEITNPIIDLKEYEFLVNENELLKKSIDEEQKEKENANKSIEALQKEIKELTNKIHVLESDSHDGKNSNTETVENSEKEELTWTDADGIKFTFTDAAPLRFNFNDKNKTQMEWIKDDESMKALIRGKSIYVKQKNSNNGY